MTDYLLLIVVQEEKVAIALLEAEEAISELERLSAETSTLRSKLLYSDFDLSHASATKAILTAKVEDYEKAMTTLQEEVRGQISRLLTVLEGSLVDLNILCGSQYPLSCSPCFLSKIHDYRI